LAEQGGKRVGCRPTAGAHIRKDANAVASAEQTASARGDEDIACRKVSLPALCEPPRMRVAISGARASNQNNTVSKRPSVISH
jgi:hypothetical protein